MCDRRPRLALVLVALLAPLPAAAEVPAPAPAAPPAVGSWQTRDEKTGAPASIVETYLQDGKLYGRVARLLGPEAATDPRCETCDGTRHGQPVRGMVVLWDLVEADGAWRDGHVLDPKNGQTYRARITMHGHDELEIHGYIGLALFGRSQRWTRVAAP